MKRCHSALEQTKHFGENGELRLENNSLFPPFYHQVPDMTIS